MDIQQQHRPETLGNKRGLLSLEDLDLAQSDRLSAALAYWDRPHEAVVLTTLDCDGYFDWRNGCMTFTGN